MHANIKYLQSRLTLFYCNLIMRSCAEVKVATEH